ncbi:hypothetical protein Y032_0688g1551 [Ancylostoma ceylanicum]|uniref:Uncharacterized protein n=1 Tax=Ancylostoma ceylanicum TaxID=53326 RepID=A0A016WGE6_9BILA|nr:hypothetical protein Y032_0688g1551 [Ancylostoma ceylanicum]
MIASEWIRFEELVEPIKSPGSDRQKVKNAGPSITIMNGQLSVVQPPLPQVFAYAYDPENKNVLVSQHSPSEDRALCPLTISEAILLNPFLRRRQ